MRPLLPLLVLGLLTAAHAQTTPGTKPSRIVPLEAELIQPLTSASVHPGDDVLVKLRQDWSDGVCRLPRAAVLHGKITSVAKLPRKNRVGLTFSYQCPEGELQKLVWIALLAPDLNTMTDISGHSVMRQAFRAPSFGEGGGLGSPGNTVSNPVDLSGRQNPTMPLSFADGEADRKARRPDAVKTGEVWRLPHLRLDVGAGLEGATELSSNDKLLSLPRGAVLVLLPESAALVPAPAAAPAADISRVASPRPSPPLPSEIAACLEPACTPATDTRHASPPSASVQTIPLDTLGYHRLRSAEMQQLEFGAATAFLGPDHLLFTFNSRELVPREANDRAEDRPHMVRAVLFNLVTGQVERSTTWRIRDERQYLWVLDGDHVLVHDGDQLLWLGPGLVQERSLALNAPLSFLRISPDRKHYAIATLREIHSPADHDRLAKTDAHGPEEQVRIQVFRDSLQFGTVSLQLATDSRQFATESLPSGTASLQLETEGLQSSRALPPLLLDQGRVELRQAHPEVFYLREFAWANGKPRDFARMHSTCIPKLQSLSTDLLLAEGCDASTYDHWVSVFREDGSPVLKQVLHSREASPLLADNGQGGAFALAVPGGDLGFTRGLSFHGADLTQETVYIHRQSDGRELSSLRILAPPPVNQPLALSSSGRRLAVIDGSRILIYNIPQ